MTTELNRVQFIEVTTRFFSCNLEYISPSKFFWRLTKLHSPYGLVQFVVFEKKLQILSYSKLHEKIMWLLIEVLIKNDFLRHKQANIKVESRRFGVIMTPFSRQSKSTALLHKAISLATCLAILLLHKLRVAIQVAWIESSAAILSWNKTSRAQKEQFDWPMPLNVATKSCREGVTLRSVGKIPCNVAKRVAESRTDRLLLFATIAATKNCYKCL